MSQQIALPICNLWSYWIRNVQNFYILHSNLFNIRSKYETYLKFIKVLFYNWSQYYCIRITALNIFSSLQYVCLLSKIASFFEKAFSMANINMARMKHHRQNIIEFSESIKNAELSLWPSRYVLFLQILRLLHYQSTFIGKNWFWRFSFSTKFIQYGSHRCLQHHGQRKLRLYN